MATTRKPTPTPTPVPVPTPPERVKVRAIAPGYTAEQKYVRPGDVFLINTEPRHPKTGEPVEYSSKWMEYVDPTTPEKITGTVEALWRQNQKTALEKAGGSKADDPLGSDD